MITDLAAKNKMAIDIEACYSYVKGYEHCSLGGVREIYVNHIYWSPVFRKNLGGISIIR